MGLKYSDLIEELIQLALNRFKQRQNFIITKKKNHTRLGHDKTLACPSPCQRSKT